VAIPPFVARTRALLADPRTWRDLLPLLLPLGLWPWLATAAVHYAQAPLFRDAGIYQYAAWCMRKGERIYDTIATPDGPVIYIVHAVLQLFTGTSESGFRRADLALHASGAFLVGALLSPRRETHRVLAILAWGVTSAAVWMCFILSNDYDASVQREQYYTLFGMGAVALAYRAPFAAGARAETAMLAAAGLVASVQMFGKHSGVIYPALAVVAVCLSPPSAEPGRTRAWRMKRLGAGALAGVLGMLLFIAVFGSLPGFAFWYFRYPFTVYRFWCAQPLSDVASSSAFRAPARAAAVALVAGGLAVATGRLPRAAVVFPAAPVLLFAAAVVQGKGWAYQVSPVLGSIHVFYVVVLTSLWSGSEAALHEGSALRRAAAVAILLAGGARGYEELQTSFWQAYSDVLMTRAEVREVRRAASALRAVTAPGDRVFVFGREPIIAFLAQRLPATPYDTGAWMLYYGPALGAPASARHPAPSEAQRAAIERLEEEVAKDACERLQRRPPAAMVFMDGVETGLDAVKTMATLCPPLETMLDSYGQVEKDGLVRVYARRR
jgi:hypothetical protein